MARVFMRLVAVVIIVLAGIAYLVPVGGVLDLSPGSDLLDLGMGLAALAASRDETWSVSMAKVLGLVYLMLPVVSFVAPNPFHLIWSDPLGAALHVSIAAACLAVGLSSRSLEIASVS